MINLKAIFDSFEDDFLKFDKIESTQSRRPDLCAFLLLDKLVPGNLDIVSAAEHDEIFLDIDCERLAMAATEEDVLFLVRCGIRFDSEYDCLALFV